MEIPHDILFVFTETSESSSKIRMNQYSFLHE
jgi:hypothetical protein